MTTEAKIAKAVFDLIEAHQLRREPIVLAHVEAVVREAMRDDPQDAYVDMMRRTIAEQARALARLGCWTITPSDVVHKETWR